MSKLRRTSHALLIALAITSGDQSIVVAESSSARSSGFPRMSRIGNELVFAWTQPDNPPRVRTAAGTLVNFQ